VAFISAATPEQLTEILDETFPLWGEGLGRAGYERYNLAQRETRWGSRHLERLVLTDGRRWLSSAKRYELEGRLDGRDVRILGIGAVFTPAEARRRGHAADLVRRLLDQAAGEGFDLAVLFSEIGTRYYASLGFVPLPLTQVRLAVNPLRGPAAIALRSGEAGDMRAICEMNAGQTASFRFTLRRRPEYAAFALAKKRLLAAAGAPGHRKVEFFVVEEGGRAAAYLVLLEVGGYWMLTECGDRDPSGARIGAMLQTLLADREHRPVHIRAWLPGTFLPPQMHVAAREVPALVMMACPLGSTRIDPPLLEGDLAWWHADAF
jgi:hypothetical protein